MKHLLFIFPIILLNCGQDDLMKDKDVETPTPTLTNLFATQVYNQIDGVDSDLLSLDIYYSSLVEEKKPVVLYVHGGGWSIGDKTNQIENKVILFQSLNYVFVSTNYRLSPFPYELDNPDRILFPTHNTDVADAIKWIIDHIDEYGGDPDKIVLLGHSAGAHLVALTGTNPSFLNDVQLEFSNIKGVAAIDTEGYDVLAQVEENNDLYINAFGTDSELNAQASPLLNIADGVIYPKFFIAKRGNANRIGIADQFISALEEQGVLVTQVDGSIYTHSEINDAIGAENEILITDALTEFLAGCFE